MGNETEGRKSTETLKRRKRKRKRRTGYVPKNKRRKRTICEGIKGERNLERINGKDERGTEREKGIREGEHRIKKSFKGLGGFQHFK